MSKTFIELKELALAGRDRSIGRILDHMSSLRFDKNTNTVKLGYRDGSKTLVTTNNNDVSTFEISNENSVTWFNSIFKRFYGVYLKKLQGYEGINRHNPWTFHVGSEVYIYVPKQTSVRFEKIYEIGDYYEDIIDRKWKNEYAQTSKRNRAALTALHKIIPFSDYTDSVKLRTKIFNQYNHGYAAQAAAAAVIDLILKTPNPTAKDVEYVRATLNIRNNQINLRTRLQRMVNNARYNRANKEGKITLTKSKNFAR